MKIPLEEISFTFARSSGAGGQNVNKVNSKAVLRWNLSRSPTLSDEAKSRIFAGAKNKINSDGDLIISSETHRDQGKNVDECLEKLERLLAILLKVEKQRVVTKKNKKSQRNRLKLKKINSEKKTNRRKTSPSFE